MAPEAPRLQVEIVGRRLLPVGGPTARTLARYARLAAAARGVGAGHLAIHVVDAATIAQLNRQFRGREGPTDVLAFPIDGWDGQPEYPWAELGDVFVCPGFADDLVEVVVHGVLHLLGMDHERDDGEMLALQAKVLGRR